MQQVLLKPMTYQSHGNVKNAQNPISFFFFALETTRSDKAHFINTTIALQYPYIYILRTSTFHKHIIHKIRSQNTFMRFPRVRSLLLPEVSVSWEGQLLGNAWRQACVCKWLQTQVELVRKPLVFGWCWV